jgi:hypothetical protein
MVHYSHKMLKHASFQQHFSNFQWVNSIHCFFSINEQAYHSVCVNYILCVSV